MSITTIGCLKKKYTFVEKNILTPILLITPPFTQLNTPYPATAYLKGFLNTKNIKSYQTDLGIEVILELFSSQRFQHLFEFAQQNTPLFSDNAKRILALKSHYIQTIDSVIAFLQGKNASLARLICSGYFLPEASRFHSLTDLDLAFGTMGLQDKAKHLATLYLEDISDFIVECVDPHFGFSRYAEKLGRSAATFDELYQYLQQKPTYIDAISLRKVNQKIQQHQPQLICFSVPFPGNLYSAFRAAQWIKQHFPNIKTAMGGGFPNTELRSIKDPRVFDFFDYITLDDGELPIEILYSKVNNDTSLFAKDSYKRTFLLENNQVVYYNNCLQKDYKQNQVGTPDYDNLPLDQYISVIEMTNPMHSLWSDGRWNKLTMAHGCYWGKCTFCDISLDYIKIYEPIAASLIVDRMEQLIAQTGEKGFHFVDEAAPPALMKAVALEIIKRQLIVTWWTNIRFEKSFTPDVCLLLKTSGCIAVSGGLEVASDRLLQLIDKGVTVAQVAQVTRNFTENGIMIHAYLMYGYPTQTVQETIDSLEMVRQLFEIGILQSGFWHQFALTAHSPIGQNPQQFGLKTITNNIQFAHNDIAFTDTTGIKHEQFSYGLKKSLYNFMHGYCLDYNLQEWFDFKIPKTKIKPDFIEKCLAQSPLLVLPKANSKMIWLGPMPQKTDYIKSKKGQKFQMSVLEFHQKNDSFEIRLATPLAHWLIAILNQAHINKPTLPTFKMIQSDFENHFDDFEPFWFSKNIEILKTKGLILL